MKNILFIIIIGIVILVSCKKDKNDDPVTQDNVRVYTEATYTDNGNISSLTRFSYDNEGTLTRTVYFNVAYAGSNDTINVTRKVTDYTRNSDSTIVVVESNLYPNSQSTQMDQYLLTLDDNGLCRLQTRVRALDGDNISYYRAEYSYSDDQYLTSRYSISYINDSITDTLAKRSNVTYSILNGNRVKMDIGSSVVNYSHYTENVNTLNYGMSFYGRIDKNPLFHETDSNGEFAYTYEYTEGKIHKRFSSWNETKQGMNNLSPLSDTIILIDFRLLEPVFTYIDLR